MARVESARKHRVVARGVTVRVQYGVFNGERQQIHQAYRPARGGGELSHFIQRLDDETGN